MAGFVLPNQKKKPPSHVDQMYNLYNTSVKKQAGDYDDIMGRLRSVYDQGNQGAAFQGYQPDLANYERSADTTKALSDLSELSTTGGLSGTDQQNLRARGISPIRSMYQNAQRDLNRQRNISGGYSPNYGAVTARMTRDQSSLIADQMDKVNANIAEMVQSGRLSAAPNYASAAQAESTLKNSFNTQNTNAKNEAKRFNASGMYDAAKQKNDQKLGAAQSMTSLYGTTPALSNLYGNQSQNAAQFENQVKQQKKNTALDLFGKAYS
jgi:hypothetical protein